MKKNIFLSIIILLIIGCLITIFNFKKNYYVSKNQIIENNKSYAIYVKESGSSSYTMQSAIPKGKYSLNIEKTICENGGTVSNYDSTNGTVLFTTLGSDRCTLYFDYKLSLKEKILEDNPTVSTRTDFSVTNVANTTGTIYIQSSTSSSQITEDINNDGIGEDVYYYSGNTTNNWVYFGGFYWRIIRTNEDGSVRLLYAGTSLDTTSGYIGKSTFNSSSTDPMYVGYMYGTSGSLANNRKNTNDSTIKGVIDTWYKENLLIDYDNYISKTAIYCNDRSIGEGTYSTSSTFYYGAYTRLNTNKTPTYYCKGNKDKFSVSTTSGGNGQLTYPIALMTADELSFAGSLIALTVNLSTPYPWYYANGEGESIIDDTTAYWWTMTPSQLYTSSSSTATVHYQKVSTNNAALSSGAAGGKTSAYVRPAISLKSCVDWSSGNGTPSNPYTVSVDNACAVAEN